jgi:hypothetical protein
MRTKGIDTVTWDTLGALKQVSPADQELLLVSLCSSGNSQNRWRSQLSNIEELAKGHIGY